LDAAVAAHMPQFDTLFAQCVPDQPMAVAATRVLLTAHQRNTILLGAAQQAFQTATEETRCGDSLVDHLIAVIELLARRSSAKLAPEIEILQSRVDDRGLQRFLVEVGKLLGIRGRANVD